MFRTDVEQKSNPSQKSNETGSSKSKKKPYSTPVFRELPHQPVVFAWVRKTKKEPVK